MKEILYLDTDFLNSFISQIYNGLPLEKQNSTKNTDSEIGMDSETNTDSENVKGDIKLISGKYATELSTITQNTVSQNKETQDIITTRMHDNALDDLIDYIKENQVEVDEGTLSVGKFVRADINLSITGIQAVADLYPDEMKEAAGLAANEDLLDQLDTLNIKIQHYSGDKSSASKLKTVRNEALKLKLQIHENNKKFANSARSAQVYAHGISTMLPTDYFIHSQKMFIPVFEKYFRPSMPAVTFLYGNDASDTEDSENIKMIGKVTRKPKHLFNTSFTRNEISDYANTFNKLLDTISNMSDWFEIGDFLVRPIAIYSDSKTL